ncbi:hemerythrin domain-containing protein [bacterium]|nr:hemerythrin domain-containing protein [bacterium]
MSALELLKKEHKLIQRYLDNMSVAQDLLIERETVPPTVIKGAIRFAKDFMNKTHHFKEEYVLFLKLAEKKGGELDPQIVSLRDQHERSRGLVSKIKEALSGYEKGDEVSFSAMAEQMGYYVSLEKSHLHREDHVFYPLAEKLFSAEEMAAFDVEFAKIDEKQGKGSFQKGVEMVEAIEADMKGKFGAVYRDRYEELVKAHHHV